jgi:hypothetical protein
MEHWLGNQPLINSINYLLMAKQNIPEENYPMFGLSQQVIRVIINLSIED